MTSRTLRLVDAEPAALAPSDAVTRVFEHWVFMLGKNPLRCALGPKRRRVIAGALELYDEETLRLAIEGCAANAWHGGDNDRGKAFNDIELILRDEPHIERFAEEGEKLRRNADHMAQERAVPAAAEPVVDEAAARAARERLRALAAQMRGGR